MKLWRYLTIIGAALLLTGMFFLPNAVASVTDSQRLDNLVTVDSQSIRFDSTLKLTLPERLALSANPKTEILPLKTGNIMDSEAANEKTDQELRRLFEGSPFRFDFNSYIVEGSDASLVIDATVPTLNLIIWELILVDKSENRVTVMLDDETGYILKLIYRLGDKNSSLTDTSISGTQDEQFHFVAQSLTDMMKEYYGYTVLLSAYQFSRNIAYYKAELFGAGRVIPMYGAVRASSFTINERQRE